MFIKELFKSVHLWTHYFPRAKASEFIRRQFWSHLTLRCSWIFKLVLFGYSGKNNLVIDKDETNCWTLIFALHLQIHSLMSIEALYYLNDKIKDFISQRLHKCLIILYLPTELFYFVLLDFESIIKRLIWRWKCVFCTLVVQLISELFSMQSGICT